MLKQRFEAIGAISDYEGLYHKLSDEAHYSFFALTSRFAEIESKEVRFRAFHHEGEESFDALRCAVAELLEKSLQALSRRFLIVQ